MQAANDNDGIDWSAPVRPSFRDLIETTLMNLRPAPDVALVRRAANDNGDMAPAMEILAALLECWGEVRPT
jgi:hypothetical protein